MIHFKYFLVFAFCFALLFSGQNFAYGNVNEGNPASGKTFTPYNPSETPTLGLGRDHENFMTYRYRFSVDAGYRWSKIMDVGDHGMWHGEGENRTQAWSPVCNNFGTVVDLNGNLHIFSILPLINWDDNPQHRVNGLYDIMVNIDGTVDYHLIYEQRGGIFQWADGGIDVNGNLYVILTLNYDVNAEERAAIFAFKSIDNGSSWNERPVQLLVGLSTENLYPHITYHIRDHFWILFQVYNNDTNLYDHYSMKVNTGLDEISEPINTGVSSRSYFSYQLPSTNPIDQDNLYGYVYFSAIDDVEGSTVIGYMRVTDEEWNIIRQPGVTNFPSVMMYSDIEEGGTPWIFGTTGAPNPGEFNHNWYTYSGLGYGSEEWLPLTAIDSIQYDGTRSLFSSTHGVFTSSGQVLIGSNVRGQVAHEGFLVNFTDNGGYTWNEPKMLVSIFDDGFEGGTLSEAQLAAGPEHFVWVAFAGRFGETDLVPPVINNIGLNTFASNANWVISADVMDELHAITSARAKFSNLHPNDPDVEWAYVNADSSHAGEADFETYFFTLATNATVRLNLSEGDSIWFVIEATDEINNIGRTWENLIIADTRWLDVNEQITVPTQISLGANYPNPFNSSTVIPFTVDKPMDVNLSVYNISGRLIQTLQNGMVTTGQHEVMWDGKSISAGIYFVRLEASDKVFISKMTLLK